jgi:hypothetical protein
MHSIKLVFETDQDHRVWIFAEDLSRSLGELGTLPMSEADSVADTLVVKKIRKRRLRRCRAFIEKLLDKHFLANVCEIVEQDGGRDE